jgi:hypothetical protein
MGRNGACYGAQPPPGAGGGRRQARGGAGGRQGRPGGRQHGPGGEGQKPRPHRRSQQNRALSVKRLATTRMPPARASKFPRGYLLFSVADTSGRQTRSGHKLGLIAIPINKLAFAVSINPDSHLTDLIIDLTRNTSRGHEFTITI